MPAWSYSSLITEWVGTKADSTYSAISELLKFILTPDTMDIVLFKKFNWTHIDQATFLRGLLTILPAH
jgi:hypothetical protein